MNARPIPVRFQLAAVAAWLIAASFASADHLRDLQAAAWSSGQAAWGHWGTNPQKYSTWTNHSNRLIPVYTIGLKLDDVSGPNTVYRDPRRLETLYGRVPAETHDRAATWFDQTDIYRLQMNAVAAGKKYVILVVFDGMDWQTTQAAAIHKTGAVDYSSGRGRGLHFQDYRGAPTGFGYFVTSPHNSGTKVDVNGQIVVNPGGTTPGGYAARRGGLSPWSKPAEPEYLLGKSRSLAQAFTDSASSATSMTAGIKTFNGSINIAADGRKVGTIAHDLQRKQKFSIGVVTSVPISHATPACAYAHNVSRGDYQDLTRDLLGLPSVSHRDEPLPGVDVLLGAGWGEDDKSGSGQGANFVPGNKYLADADQRAIDSRFGGKYTVVTRTAGTSGKDQLQAAGRAAIAAQQRLFGFFGVARGHLPYRTADGGYDPTRGVKPAERYTPADISENPTIADMTRVALEVLSSRDGRFWLMVEPGDVDWANHDNNIDNSIGAVLSGDDAVREITRWAEAHDCWDETAVIVTADHGHFLVLEDPAALTSAR